MHCALLTGLLSHIGNKDLEKPEFLGARNARFHALSGLGLFKKPPKWVMAAELTETSRLTPASTRIEPEWIEPWQVTLSNVHHSGSAHWSKKTAP